MKQAAENHSGQTSAANPSGFTSGFGALNMGRTWRQNRQGKQDNQHGRREEPDQHQADDEQIHQGKEDKHHVRAAFSPMITGNV